MGGKRDGNGGGDLEVRDELRLLWQLRVALGLLRLLGVRLLV